MAYAYSDPTFLSNFGTGSAVANAAETYRQKMLSISAGVRARKFGEDGLCLGMPFVWRSLDPGTIPFFFAV